MAQFKKGQSSNPSGKPKKEQRFKKPVNNRGKTGELRGIAEHCFGAKNELLDTLTRAHVRGSFWGP